VNVDWRSPEWSFGRLGAHWYTTRLLEFSEYVPTSSGLAKIKRRILVSQGYSSEEALKIISGNGTDSKGHKVDIRKRGKMNGEIVDVLNFPTSTPDPQIETTQGRYAYGFNLDGKAGPSSFEDPETHEQGIDNQMWRVLGCFEVYDVRRPVVPYNESIAWDTAEDAMPAWLVSIAGENLDKDGDVTVTFDRALNIVMRDAHGSVLPGSSYQIDSDPRSHSEFKGHIKDQVLTIEPGPFSMQGESQFYAVLRFTQTHLRLKMNPNGTLSGIIGGYQPWLDYYHYLSIRGENDGLVDLPGVYYAMKRLADSAPDPKTGQNMAISAAYYIEAAPVFLTTTDAKVVSTAHLTDIPIHQTAVADQNATAQAVASPAAAPQAAASQAAPKRK